MTKKVYVRGVLEEAELEDSKQEGLGKRKVDGAQRADIKCSIFEQFLKCNRGH